MNTSSKPRRKYYWWICDSNLKHRHRISPNKKVGHKENVYYRKRMGGNNKVCELWLGEIIDNPKISLAYNIDSLPNSTFSTNQEI